MNECLATSVTWDTAGKKISFSPTPPKVLSWDLQDGLEGKARKNADKNDKTQFEQNRLCRKATRSLWEYHTR